MLTVSAAFLTVGQASESAFSNLTEWYVDATYGDDATGTGRVDEPFKSICALLEVNESFPEFVGMGDTIHLAAGYYGDESVVIDISNLSIKGIHNGNGRPKSVLGSVEITADGVSLSNCLFFDAGLTLRGVEGVSIENNVFSGTTKVSMKLLGSSGNSIRGNYFESATESCVLIRCDSKSKQSSSENVFKANYFTHHPDEGTDQVILSNKRSSLKSLFGKKRPSFGNRFVNCAFEEMKPGRLKQVISDHNTWQMVADHGYSLMFEDCYFKKADRRVPFVSFVVVGEPSKMDWYWDDLANDTWVASNSGHGLTGHKNNGYTPSIQFVDSDENGLILEIGYPEGVGRFYNGSLPEQENDAPVVLSAITDIVVYEDAEPDVINLFDVFEDTVTADEDLVFSISCDDPSLLSIEIEKGLLMLSYIKKSVGMTQITVTAMDDDSMEPLSAKDTFNVFIVESTDDSRTEQNDWYVDSTKGNDASGTGSQSKPFKTLKKLFSLHSEQPNLKSSGGTIYLGTGNYGRNLWEINIPGLIIKGTLDKRGRPATVLGETLISADGVQLMNCEFWSAGLTLRNVEDVLISNNVFSGTTNISLSLLGASQNTIQHNEFGSAVHDCIHIYWDPDSGRASRDNIFLQNYFTHRSNDTTSRVVRVNWVTGKNNSISARNRFIECAIKETSKGKLPRVIDDECTWWMVSDHQYAVAFEDCYFKRADRTDPFNEFVILEGHPNYKWRWDELENDEWVSTNKQWGITGDHSGWNHRPRIQFLDKNGNGKALETVYNAGLLSVGKRNLNDRSADE